MHCGSKSRDVRMRMRMSAAVPGTEALIELDSLYGYGAAPCEAARVADIDDTPQAGDRT